MLIKSAPILHGRRKLKKYIEWRKENHEGMKEFNVADYGVLSDCERLQTDRIQSVIDCCREQGGGEIIFPAGSYHVGSLRLYSNMTMRLLAGAKLLGSKDYRDYADFHVPSTLEYLKDDFYIKSWNLPPYYIYGIICAFEAENIAVIGEKGSVIDGQDCYDANGEEKFRGPMGMVFSQCSNLRLEGYTFVNSANWSHQIDSCRDISIDRVTILAGHDGFNLHHSKDIRITDCRIESGDDCFAGYDIENLTVNDCYINTACNSMRIGGYKLRFERCRFEGPGHYPHISEDTYYTHAMFKYYAIRPDRIARDAQDIVLRDCTIQGIPILLSYQFRKEGLHQDNRPLRSLVFDHVRISEAAKTSFFKGNGEVCRLVFKNCEISFDGGEESAFLEIDDSIELVMDHVIFDRETKIAAGKNSVIEAKECRNMVLERKLS